MIPLAYNYRNLLVRWKTTLMTAAGFTLVVAALIIMLAFVNGLQIVCVISGQPENVLVMKKGATDEVFSQIDPGLATQVENTDGVAKDRHGRPLASRELFMVISQQDEATREYKFLQVRGLLVNAPDVHTQVGLTAGRMFIPAQSEIVVGDAVAREDQLTLGSTLRIGRKNWKVVGIMKAGGSSFESEMWCDLNELASHFRREGTYTSVVLRTAAPAAAKDLAQRLATSRTVSVEALLEPAYYEKQAEQTTQILTAGMVIAVFMAIGAVFGVMNTMFAAIGQRIKDIAVMRILGFRRFEILVSFLLEAVLIGLVGGGLGTALGYATNGVTRSAVIGAGAKAVEFAFRVDTRILVTSTTFVVVMSLLGGILPALSAMRVRPLESLR